MKRLDQWLVDEGFFPSRERARLAIMAGEVRVEGRGRDLKAGTRVRPGDRVTVSARPRFVSRGGDKLEGVLERWGIEVAGRLALDVGASTGGFTHCLLERGAARVICLDVGRGQLHWELRNHPGVTVMERTNVRHVRPEDLPFVPELVVADLSFISLRLVFPVLGRLMAGGGELIALIKPQFEAGRGKVGKKGVVRDPDVHREVLEAVAAAAAGCGFELLDLVPSPLRGAEGNMEYFGWWRRNEDAPPASPGAVEKAVREAWERSSGT